MSDNDARQAANPPLVIALTLEQVKLLTDQQTREVERLQNLGAILNKAFDQQPGLPSQRYQELSREALALAQQPPAHEPQRPNPRQYRPAPGPQPGYEQVAQPPAQRQHAHQPPPPSSAPELRSVLTALQAHHQRYGAQHGATLEIPTDLTAKVHIVATPEIDRQIADARAAFFAQREQLITLHKEAWPPAAKEVTERQEGRGTPPPAARPQDRGPPHSPSPTIADDRFASAPLDRAELAALARAPDFREASRLLGQFQQARTADGRLLHHDPQREPVLNRIFPPKEQVELGLQPTANEVTALQRDAAEQWRRTLSFVNERERANAYWYSRALRSTPAAERLERTEQREGRGQRDRVAAARAHLKERMDRHFADGPDRDSHSRGGGRDR